MRAAKPSGPKALWALSLCRPAPPAQPPTGYLYRVVGPGERDGTAENSITFCEPEFSRKLGHPSPGTGPLRLRVFGLVRSGHPARAWLPQAHAPTQTTHLVYPVGALGGAWAWASTGITQAAPARVFVGCALPIRARLAAPARSPCPASQMIARRASGQAKRAGAGAWIARSATNPG